MSEITINNLKNSLIKYLYHDDKIVKLIDDNKIKISDDLLGTHIFPFFKVNYTLEETGTYICIKIDELNDSYNKSYKPYKFSIMIISHMDHLLCKGNSRVDLIGERVKELFNWNDNFGFQLELNISTEGILNERYYYRTLEFQSITYNNLQNKIGRNNK